MTQIQYFHEFIELAHRLNFRAAAKALFISQSTLSKHIISLEATYDVNLLDRSHNGVVLTREGALLLEYAEDIWEKYRKSHEAIDARKQTRPLNIAGVIESPDEHNIATSLYQYMSDHHIQRPIHIKRLDNFTYEYILNALELGQIDCFVFYNLNEFKSVENAHLERIREIPLDIYVSKESALADRGSISISELAGASFIHITGGYFTPIWHMIEQLLVEHGIPYTSIPIYADSIYEYINVKLDSNVLVVPRRNYVIDQGKINNAVRLTVKDEDFKLDLDAITIGDDEATQVLVKALRKLYR